jgi:hypothetical protein
VSNTDLEEFMPGAARMRNPDGIIVTVPHELGSYRYCASPNERAHFLGGINILHRNGWEPLGNADAREGLGTHFGRGSLPYNREGEAQQQRNPCVAPIGQGPFYAARIVASSLVTFVRLHTDYGAFACTTNSLPLPHASLSRRRPLRASRPGCTRRRRAAGYWAAGIPTSAH